jgi:hypothetical protein
MAITNQRPQIKKGRGKNADTTEWFCNRSRSRRLWRRWVRHCGSFRRSRKLLVKPSCTSADALQCTPSRAPTFSPSWCDELPDDSPPATRIPHAKWHAALAELLNQGRIQIQTSIVISGKFCTKRQARQRLKEWTICADSHAQGRLLIIR